MLVIFSTFICYEINPTSRASVTSMKSEKFYVSFYEMLFENESDQNRPWFSMWRNIFRKNQPWQRFRQSWRRFIFPLPSSRSVSSTWCSLLYGDFLVSGSRNLQLRFRWQYGCRVLVVPQRIPNQRDSIRRVSRTHACICLRDPPAPVSLNLFVFYLSRWPFFPIYFSLFFPRFRTDHTLV